MHTGAVSIHFCFDFVGVCCFALLVVPGLSFVSGVDLANEHLVLCCLISNLNFPHTLDFFSHLNTHLEQSPTLCFSGVFGGFRPPLCVSQSCFRGQNPTLCFSGVFCGVQSPTLRFSVVFWGPEPPDCVSQSRFGVQSLTLCFSAMFWVHQGQFPPEISSVGSLFVFLRVNMQHFDINNGDRVLDTASSSLSSCSMMELWNYYTNNDYCTNCSLYDTPGLRATTLSDIRAS